MDLLTGFRTKGFLDQIALLSEVEDRKRTDLIPQLMEFFLSPIGDAAVDTMIRSALRMLMLADPKAVLNSLASDDKKERLFSMGIAAESGLEESAPILIHHAEETQDPDDLMDVLRAMRMIGAREFLPIFTRHVDHPDPLVAAMSLEMMGAYHNHDALDSLVDVVRRNEEDDRYAICEVTTWSAILALGQLGSEESLAALAGLIHHKNPTARRIIHETLCEAGSRALPHLTPLLTSGRPDEKIMALNLMGMIGERKEGAAIIAALDKGYLDSPNMKFAAYEALGRMPSMRSLVCLMDGLEHERDPLVLTAVIHGLNDQLTETTAAKAVSIIKKDLDGPDSRGHAILSAVVVAKAIKLFALLHADAEVGPLLVDVVAASQSRELVAEFLSVLSAIDSERARQDASTLSALQLDDKKRQILAIDDSGAMRNFYHVATSQLGLSITTASNGREAYDILSTGTNVAGTSCGPFTLIIVDMNMPVMDGVEFTRKAREMDEYRETPILMVTTESDAAQAKLAKEAGINAFLSKPFTIEGLQHKIDRLL